MNFEKGHAICLLNVLDEHYSLWRKVKKNIVTNNRNLYLIKIDKGFNHQTICDWRLLITLCVVIKNRISSPSKKAWLLDGDQNPFHSPQDWQPKFSNHQKVGNINISVDLHMSTKNGFWLPSKKAWLSNGDCKWVLVTIKKGLIVGWQSKPFTIAT